MRRLLCALIATFLLGSAQARDGSANSVDIGQLPDEARQTLQLIDAGGPLPYRRDGIVFENREHLLPGKPHGYYREYTVPTPGRSDRGARRIVTGDNPPVVFYYTADHYRSFHRIQR